MGSIFCNVDFRQTGSALKSQVQPIRQRKGMAMTQVPTCQKDDGLL